MTTAAPSILVVEDDPAIRAMLLSALRRESLHVESAVDGMDGLQKAKEHDFAVVVVDLMMPRMDGFAFVEELRLLRTDLRPIVFVMTAYDDAMLHRLEPGTVHAYLRKPFDVSLLVEMVRDCAEAVDGSEELYIPPPMGTREDNVC
jgi:CheY-like chemotaxis protein